MAIERRRGQTRKACVLVVSWKPFFSLFVFCVLPLCVSLVSFIGVFGAGGWSGLIVCRAGFAVGQS